MASSATTALRNRDNGRRSDQKHRGKAVDQSFLGVSNLGANRLNIAQVYEIERLYATHPAVQAARTVLHAQLFSGGLTLFRDCLRLPPFVKIAARQKSVTRSGARLSEGKGVVRK